VGGSAHGRITELAALECGGLRVPHPIVALPDGGRGFFGATWADGTLGAPILRRTRLTLDYRHKQMFFEPAEPLEASFAFDASGLSQCAREPDLATVEIDHVADGSAGAKAGLVAGEALLGVDGKPVTGASLDQVAALFAREGETRSLHVEGRGQGRDVLLRLESNGLR